MKPALVTPPADPPVTLSSIKAHLRVDVTDSDAVLTELVDEATAYLDGYSGILGRCLVTQVWSQSFEEFPDGDIRLPFPDVSAVTVTYRDTSDATQTLATTVYTLSQDNEGSLLSLKDGQEWPDTSPRVDAVTVQMTAGYGGPDDVPGGIKRAIKLMVERMYDRSEGPALAANQSAVDMMLAPLRVVGV